MRLAVLVSIFLSACYQINGQLLKDDSTKVNHFLQAGFGFGAIVAHNNQVRHLAQSHPNIYRLEYSLVDPRPEWSKSFGMPRFGLALDLFNYQNGAQLGQSLAATIYLEPRLFQRFRFRLGSGLVYNFHPFNLKSNPGNLMLGSRFALVMHGQINYYQPVSARYQLVAGWGITHFSNGAYTQPNMGINIVYGQVGLIHQWDKPVQNFSEIAQPKTDFHLLSIQAWGSLSWVEKLPVGGPKFPVYQASLRASYRKGRKSSLAMAVDYAYNESRAKLIEEKPGFGPKEGRIGLVISHELHISRISLMTDVGYYILKRQTIDPGLYQRYGFRYYIKKSLFLVSQLKVHRSKAECFEFGLGSSFLNFSWSK